MPEILIGVAIDVVVNQQESFVASLGFETPKSQIAMLGVLTFLIWAGESLFEYLYLVLWRNLAQDLQADLRQDAYEQVQRQDMGFFESRSSGELTAILNDDVNQLERFLDGGANDFLQVFVSVILVGGVFFYVSPSIAILAITPIPIIIWGAFFFMRRATPLYADVRAKVGSLASRLNNNIGGMATIKSFTAESRESTRLRSASDGYVQANREAIQVSSAFVPLIRMAILAGFLCTFVLGGFRALDGTLNVGAYGMLVFLTQRLLWPLTRLAQTVDLYERAMASTRRILGLIDTETQVRDSGAVELPSTLKGSVSFEDISFCYPGTEVGVHQVSLTIAAGTTVALVGTTGSGKSTLIKLLLRFYPFEGSVRENIAYGDPEANDDAVEAAAIAAEAMGFINELPQGLETLVGERGIKLSGGQRQRLSLARAILKNPPVLILDEATSAVDNETEAAIQRSLAVISQQRTVLMVAHRLSTIVGADEIVVLENGQIVERGTHTALIASNGHYARQWSVQTGAMQLGTGVQP